MSININTIKTQLPKCPGIMGKSEFINTAVLVSLVLKAGELHFLFEERSSSIRQGGEICFPGGFYQKDIDNSFEQTAIRETTEELGINASKIEILGPMDTLLAPIGVTIDPFVGVLHIDDIFQLNINNHEVARVFLLPVSYFQKHAPEIYQVKPMAHPVDSTPDGKTKVLLPFEKLGLPKRYHQPWGGVPMNIYVYHTPEAMIWGLTAKIVYYFLLLYENQKKCSDSLITK